MKFPGTYYLLLLYITVVMKPLIPYIQDGWDHQFNEIEHVSTVHAKYGSHHLTKELANSATDNKGREQNTSKTVDPVPFHVLATLYDYDIKMPAGAINYVAFPHTKLPFICIPQQALPPKFS